MVTVYKQDHFNMFMT